MTIPLFEKDGFIICFEAEGEHESMHRHFTNDCGWSEAEFEEIEHCAWFSAKVSAWKDGEELGADYLGCCCYETPKEFYTTCKDGYFADMVDEAIREARDTLARRPA